jgi:hypothetical protein
MKQTLLTFVFSFIVFQLSSQNTIGFRSSLLWLKFSTENIESQEIDYSTEDIQITRDFDIDFYFINQKKENMRWIYQLGYRRFISTRELNQIKGGTLDVSTRRRVLIRYRALVGIEKKVDLKPLTLFYGLELPFEYEPKGQNVWASDMLDDNDNIIGRFESIEHTPDAYRFGLYFNLKFYHFFNRIGVGVEFINGLSFHKPTKEIKGELITYDVNDQLIESIDYRKEEKRLVINKTSFMGIGLRYKLNK